MDPISLFKKTKFSNTIWWQLKTKIQGFQCQFGNNLVTEILEDRRFRLVEKDLSFKDWQNKSRILVQLFEDGYLCWVEKDKLCFEEYSNNAKAKIICDQFYIQEQIPFILDWIKKQSELPNEYLWGGTVGPDYDCSGLIQTAFLIHNIFIPRDSYQIKNFCNHISDYPVDLNLIKMGDILFFGNQMYCNHVGIYFQNGYYYHSSGKDNGRNGIGMDSLINQYDLVSNHYKSQFISAGRVTRSYQWNKTLR